MKGIIVNRSVWIEGLILVAIGLLSLAESFRLIFSRDPTPLQDLLGPGYYVLGVSIGMLVTGVIYIYHHSRDTSG